MSTASFEPRSELMPSPLKSSPPPLPDDAAEAMRGAATLVRAVVSGTCGEVDLDLGTASFAGVTIGCCNLLRPGELVQVRVLRRFDGSGTLALDPPVDIFAGIVELDDVDDVDDVDERCGGALLSPGTGFTLRVELGGALELLSAPTIEVVGDAEILDSAERVEAYLVDVAGLLDEEAVVQTPADVVAA